MPIYDRHFLASLAPYFTNSLPRVASARWKLLEDFLNIPPAIEVEGMPPEPVFARTRHATYFESVW